MQRKEMLLFNDALNTFMYDYIGYSFRLAARDLLYAPSHIQDSTYHGDLDGTIEMYINIKHVKQNINVIFLLQIVTVISVLTNEHLFALFNDGMKE